jgi:peptidyl-prolyl cis-trans isomerase A (cyclophilin A)
MTGATWESPIFARDFSATGTKMATVNRSTFLRIVIATITVTSFAWAQPVQAADPVVVMKTSEGTFEITLDPKNAPITTANFLAYVDKKFYDGLLIYRDVKGFVAQGGGLTPQGSGKPEDAPIKDEAHNGLHNARGTISMARTNDPNSATTQFFLNFVDNSGSLDPSPMSPDGYAVFGKITKGMDVLDKIEALGGTDPMGGPSRQITIVSIRRK